MALRFGKILCPVEFEENSAAVVKFAGHSAEPASTLYLLHVIPHMNWPDFERYPPAAQLARESLENFARENLPASFRRELLVRSGDPAEVIVGVARELDVDVIMMATHGRKGIAHFVLGSVAERVVREANHPVLTLRPEIAIQPKSA